MWQAFKQTLKRAIKIGLFYSGLAWLFYAFSFRRRAVVLMYHRVLPGQPPADAFSADAIIVTPTTFDRQMRFLKRFFNPVSLTEFEAMLNGHAPWRPRTCVVTFDDGWYDNVEYALPVLHSHSVPAAVFVATHYLGSDDTFWPERLTRWLFNVWRTGAQARIVFEELGAPEILQMDEPRARSSIRHLVTRIKSIDRAERERIFLRVERYLSEHAQVPRGCGNDRFMSWPDAAKLLDGGVVAIGSHAHSHRPLTSIDATELRDELARSRRLVEAHLGFAPPFFAYPNGDYNDGVASEVRNAGYRLAFTTDPGWVYPGDDPLRLKRINIGERGTDSSAGFLCRLLGWL